MSDGYACIKGIEAPAIHNAPDRLFHPLKRQNDGSFVRVPLEQALDEIAGRQRIEAADVFMAFGYNPLLSVQGGFGFTVNNPTKTMRSLKARGMKLIVIDPRRTETAHFSDIHLQPLPGEDAVIAAGMLALILAEGWDDVQFCERWVPGLEDLRVAVAPFTPDYVAARAGIDETLFRGAVRLFAHQSQRGIAMTGTGPDMATYSNLTNHLVECINVVCGRFNREGERIANTGVLERRRRWRAQARSPRRRFEAGPKSRVRGLGRLYGEMMTPTLPEEILTPGQGQIRALINVGGNPASAFPDQQRTVAALRSLELLASLDPVMSNTAKLSHYIIPPKLMLERPDAPTLWETLSYPVPFAQYTPAVAKPPAQSEVVDEWYVFWALAKRLGYPISYCGEVLDMDKPPDTEHLLDLITRDAQLPLAEVRKHPGGVVYEGAPQFVAPSDANCAGAFDVAPEEVLAEIAALRDDAASPANPEYTHRLAVRRTREVLNSAYRDIPAMGARDFNPASLHPDDLAALGLADGDRVEIFSEHGSIAAIVKADETLRCGVVTMSHGFGGLPEEAIPYEQVGANTNLLVSLDKDVQAINGMARFSAIPVFIRPAPLRSSVPPVV